VKSHNGLNVFKIFQSEEMKNCTKTNHPLTWWISSHYYCCHYLQQFSLSY